MAILETLASSEAISGVLLTGAATTGLIGFLAKLSKMSSICLFPCKFLFNSFSDTGSRGALWEWTGSELNEEAGVAFGATVGIGVEVATGALAATGFGVKTGAATGLTGITGA